ncbi:MAG: SufE family protein [Pseudomonadota bacterium]
MTPESAARFQSNPFGQSVTREDVADTLGFLDDWEDRYRYVIELGQQLVPLPEADRTEDRLVRGCQSQVWLLSLHADDRVWYLIDSDAHIVRGLAAIVLSAYNGRTPREIVDFDVEAWFETLDLVNHLSPTRGNGLRAMVARMVAAAQAPA